MSMGFPNLVEEEKNKDGCSKKKMRSTDVRTVALGCTRQVSLAEKKAPEELKAAAVVCSAGAQAKGAVANKI